MNTPNYTALSVTAALQVLKTDRHGLTPTEASRRLQRQPTGTLWHPRGDWLLAGLRRVAGDSFFIILLLGELLAWYLGSGYTMLALGVALGLNLWAHSRLLYQARRASQAHQRLLRQPARLLRSGKQLELPAHELVTGDIVLLAAGDTVPADLRLVRTDRLVVDERAVGGDSQHRTKTAAAGSGNLALLGSRVVGGSGSGIVIALGTRTVMGKHVASIDALLAQAVAVPAQARLTGLRHRVAQTALVLAAALTLLAAVAQVGWQDYLWLLVALAAAVVPTGLAGELSVLHTIRSAPITWITRAASSDVGAKLTLVCLGTLGLALYHVPLGITVVQLVVLDLVAMLLPITALGGERPRAVSQHVVRRLLGFSALSGLLAYGSFLSFFWREGLSPAHLSPTSHLYFHAATIGFITLVLCRYLGLLYVRADNEPRFFTAELWRNQRLAAAFAISALVLVACLYLPVLRPYVTTWPLGPLDWLTIIVAGAVYLSCNQLERHTRRHTRQALLARHGTETLRKHLKLI